MNVIFLLWFVTSSTSISLAIASSTPTLPPPTNARVTTRDGQGYPPFPAEGYVGKEIMICSRLPGDVPVTLNRDVNVRGYETSAFKCVCDAHSSQTADLVPAPGVSELFARGNPLYVSPEEAQRREKKRQDTLTRYIEWADNLLADNLVTHSVSSQSWSIRKHNEDDMRIMLSDMYDKVLAEARKEGH